MSIIPGWDSIAGAHWWSNFYFWASIFSLIALGVTEVVSHRYSEREDELAAIEQEATKKTHEDEIARLHVESSRLAADAETARAQIAEANARALEAQLALEKFKAPRSLNSEQRENLIADLTRFAGQKFSGIVAGGIPDASKFWSELVATLTAAKWQLLPPAGDAAGNPPAGIPINPNVGVIIALPLGEEGTCGPPAIALATGLSNAGIAATAIRSANPQNRNGVIVIAIGSKP
jgi:hypothetical protein